MEALLEGLNGAQRAAVTSPASVLQVLAPPGSGKTKTLTARVAYLINHEKLQPWNIIVCTFTLKATSEMKERIRGFVGDGIEKKLILGTFHSVARRFLVRYGQEIGIPKNFGIADSGDSKSIIKRIIDRRQQCHVHPNQARTRISGLKSRNVSAARFAVQQKKADDHEFACIYSEYEEYLKAQKLLDYDDLLVRCVELLEKHPKCVSTIKAVLIDEYQDTNNVQYELMKLLAQANRCITIVGDPDQSIYGFRAAEIKNLRRMQREYPESSVINLEKNYRSSGSILKSAMAVIKQDTSRINKSLHPTHDDGDQPTLRHLATAQEEARWIVEEIQRTENLTAGLLSNNDYAILIRAATLSLSIERALGRAGIPYRMVGGLRFFDRAEIKILLDYLRVINQPDCNDVLVRILNKPSRKIGESTIKALLQEAEEQKITLWTLVLDSAKGERRPQTKIPKPAQQGIDTFVNLILTSQQKLDPKGSCSLLDLINHVCQKMKFEAFLKSTYKEDWKERWANVEELVSQATQMAASVANGEEVADDALPEDEGEAQRLDTTADILSKFLANVALSTAVEQPGGEEVNQVTISTIHAAKGLEWPVVFIPAVYMGSIPHSRAEDHDEERRLLYVGMTRAQALLYLSCPVKLASSDETVLSKFISEPSIQKFFSRCGPSIGFSAIQVLAQILRRDCPLAVDIQAAQSLVERVEDDKYVMTRDEIDREESSWLNGSDSNNRAASPPFKRPKFQHSKSKLGGTLHSGPNLSISSTTVTATTGFTTAKDIRTLQQQAENARLLACAQDLSGRHPYNEVSILSTSTKTIFKATPSAQTKKAKAPPTGQGAITNFFKRPASALSEELEDIPSSPLLASSRSQPPLPRNTHTPFSSARPLTDVSNTHTQTQSQPCAYNPLSLSAHTLRRTPMQSKPKPIRPALPSAEQESRRRHVLLSSSPTKPDFHDDDAGKNREAEDEVQDEVEPEVRPEQPTVCGFRPATTLHTTSMSQVLRRAGNGGRGRKTLGARRSVVPWSAKNYVMPRPKGAGSGV